MSYFSEMEELAGDREKDQEEIKRLLAQVKELESKNKKLVRKVELREGYIADLLASTRSSADDAQDELRRAFSVMRPAGN